MAPLSHALLRAVEPERLGIRTCEQEVEVEDVARLRFAPPRERVDLLRDGRVRRVVRREDRRQPVRTQHLVDRLASNAAPSRVSSRRENSIFVRTGTLEARDAKARLPPLRRVGLLRCRDLDDSTPFAFSGAMTSGDFSRRSTLFFSVSFG